MGKRQINWSEQMRVQEAVASMQAGVINPRRPQILLSRVQKPVDEQMSAYLRDGDGGIIIVIVAREGDYKKIGGIRIPHDISAAGLADAIRVNAEALAESLAAHDDKRPTHHTPHGEVDLKDKS